MNNAIDRLRTDAGTRRTLCGHALDLDDLARGMNGGELPAATRQSAAYHEAAHAILYEWAGYRVKNIRVARREGAWCGWCAVKGPSWEVSESTSAREGTDRACIMVAGFLGELIGTPDRAIGSGVDELAVARAVSETIARKSGMEGGAVMAYVLTYTLDVLERHRLVLDLLARDLVREGKVNGKDLTRALRPVRATAPD